MVAPPVPTEHATRRTGTNRRHPLTPHSTGRVASLSLTMHDEPPVVQRYGLFIQGLELRGRRGGGVMARGRRNGSSAGVGAETAPHLPLPW